MKGREDVVTTARLVETVEAMLRVFRNQLSGPKQATRKQMVEYLARGLEIPFDSAEHLFDELRQAGIILRADDGLGADFQFPETHQQQWEIQAAESHDTSMADIVETHILPRNQLIRPLNQLGLSRFASSGFDALRDVTDGLVLVAGPTGAGKSTTVYSVINHLDDGRQSVTTIEDPIEYRIPSFTQMEVDPRRGITYPEGVKTALRMDPDIILLGEIRDTETAIAAMRASSCGKRVFSTFHARDAAAAMTALLDFGVTAKSLAANLRGIISQRLVRRVCSKCYTESPLSSEARGLFESLNLEPPAKLRQANGCAECRQTGYRDRIGVFEVVVNTPELADATQEGWSELQLRQLLRDQGTPCLATDALQKVSEGMTTLDEVLTMAWVQFLAGTIRTSACGSVILTALGVNLSDFRAGIVSGSNETAHVGRVLRDRHGFVRGF